MIRASIPNEVYGIDLSTLKHWLWDKSYLNCHKTQPEAKNIENPLWNDRVVIKCIRVLATYQSQACYGVPFCMNFLAKISWTLYISLFWVKINKERREDNSELYSLGTKASRLWGNDTSILLLQPVTHWCLFLLTDDLLDDVLIKRIQTKKHISIWSASLLFDWSCLNSNELLW